MPRTWAVCRQACLPWCYAADAPCSYLPLKNTRQHNCLSSALVYTSLKRTLEVVSGFNKQNASSKQLFIHFMGIGLWNSQPPWCMQYAWWCKHSVYASYVLLWTGVLGFSTVHRYRMLTSHMRKVDSAFQGNTAHKTCCVFLVKFRRCHQCASVLVLYASKCARAPKCTKGLLRALETSSNEIERRKNAINGKISGERRKREQKRSFGPKWSTVKEA